MIARELWQHRTSGEVYAVQLDEQSQVTAAAGPLQPDAHQAPLPMMDEPVLGPDSTLGGVACMR